MSALSSLSLSSAAPRASVPPSMRRPSWRMVSPICALCLRLASRARSAIEAPYLRSVVPSCCTVLSSWTPGWPVRCAKFKVFSNNSRSATTGNRRPQRIPGWVYCGLALLADRGNTWWATGVRVLSNWRAIPAAMTDWVSFS